MQSNFSGPPTHSKQDDVPPLVLFAEVHDAAEDAVYGVRAWARGIHWRAVAIAVATALIAFLQADSTVLVASLTGLVILLVPRADRDVTHALIETMLIKAKVVKQPPNESLFRPRKPTDPNHDNLPRP